MKRTIALWGSMLVAMGFKANASIPARKETTPRPAIVKELPFLPHQVPQQQKGAVPAQKSGHIAKSASIKKAPLPIKSAAIPKAAPAKTKHH